MAQRQRTEDSRHDQAESAAERIKDAALKLFSARGIDGVTVRQIVAEAGARNNASLHYYFGSKDALVRALILECAHLSDSARIRRLDEIEAAGGPREVAEIIRLIVEVETTPRGVGSGGAMGASSGHMRFVMGLQINNRRVFMQALTGHRNSGYLRCIDHIYRLLPGIPKSVLNQRLIFMDLFMGSTLAAREAAFEQDPTGGKLWSSELAIENLIISACGILTAGPITAPPEVQW
ncbi:regulatory protein, TetR [Pseudooceanicola batsensis HTCC2597]|uniref:Regulatory protein, TetR n=1 Tax=Pseudooceanicola batsensis (strain ATCC BAA-863 / DSM 15984 / KCTC 12145 / HTCC2597) TaxID=252305 RepID=A3TSQ2_PSEBH|nr:TetR/AcrR family transcriptional regulator [Pseudooceanicola batsensis]EAQ04679.1 regulatory protein, TetR [Pseudooceanicola batsensis HTCC2597]